MGVMGKNAAIAIMLSSALFRQGVVRFTVLSVRIKMKKRLIVDGVLVWSMSIITAVFLMWPDVYVFHSFGVDNILDALGIIFIIKGCMFRLCARGHKRKFPRWDLVTTGPYAISRNPMYLGSFMIGMGILLIVWPWWTLPLYIVGFYCRFNQEVIKEEEQLLGCHKGTYEEYMKNTPRIYPTLSMSIKAKTRDIFNIEEILSTKDKWNLLAMPAAAILLDVIQENRLFGGFNFMSSIGIFIVTIIVFAFVMTVSYKVR